MFDDDNTHYVHCKDCKGKIYEHTAAFIVDDNVLCPECYGARFAGATICEINKLLACEWIIVERPMRKKIV